MADGGEAVLGQAALGRPGGAVELGNEAVEEDLAVRRQVEAPVGLIACFFPAPVVIDQVPERDVVAALCQEQPAGAQRVADGEGQGDLPDGTVELAACFAGCGFAENMSTPSPPVFIFLGMPPWRS